MRLIDIDEIRIPAECLYDICGQIMISTEDLVKILFDAPVVEIVRCRECKKEDCTWRNTANPDWYCAEGEK